MINQQFFDDIALLEDEFAKKPSYNLFSVLRSESDEVRLHSRFLADLFNPKGSHQHQMRFLTLLLERLGVVLSGQISVDLEYKNIDILIRSKECAVIIENKIYAGDQPKQLARYHQLMRDEGYRDIRLVYLTLDGTPPSDDSTDGLSEEDLDDKHFTLLSYEDDIYALINRCIEIAASDVPLRESLIQYKNIIAKLTLIIENKEHMDALKKLLISDNNLASIPTLLSAYQEVLIELQIDLWKRIGAGVRTQFGELEKNSITAQPERDQYVQVKNYVENKPKSKFLCITTKVNGYDNVYLKVEQDHQLYFGVVCENDGVMNQAQDIMTKTANIPHTEAWGNFGTSAFAQPNMNFKHLTPDDLTYLSKEENRQAYADFIVHGLKEFADVLKLNELNLNVAPM